MGTHIARGIEFYRVKVTFNLVHHYQVVCNPAGKLYPVQLTLLIARISRQVEGAVTSSKIIFGR